MIGEDLNRYGKARVSMFCSFEKFISDINMIKFSFHNLS